MRWLGRAWILLIVAMAVVTVANAAVINSGEKSIVESVRVAPKADVAIVLGAKVRADSSLTPVLHDRMRTGVELYRAGKVRKLLLTGDQGTTAYDEVNNMRRYALRQKVAPRDIFMDHAGFDTYDSMVRARKVFGVRTALVVTQRFHLARAVYIARDAGIRATGVPSDKRAYQQAFLFDAREILARTKAYFDVEVFRPKPKFLGPKIDIRGDGRVTWDKKG